jgi:hypothetical protein
MLRSQVSSASFDAFRRLVMLACMERQACEAGTAARLGAGAVAYGGECA